MKKLIFIIAAILSLLSVKAQLPQPPKTALSPNAASLGLFGDVPVSHFTGTPNISIPLYELSVGDYTLPITLRYHAAGIRPDQLPGWVGLGWSLDAGGVITRQVKDMPDDFNNPNYHLGGRSGFYYTHGVLNTDQWNQRSYLRSVAQKSELVIKDTEPDEFSFSFPGYSGKFYIDHQGNWTVQCNRPVKVVFDNQFLDIPFDTEGTRAQSYGYSPSFSGFTIVTEHGVQYVFGGDIAAIEYSIGFFEQYGDDWVATAWYLKQIILPSKKVIDFTYQRGDFTNQMYISVYHDLGASTEGSGGIFNPQPACSSQSYASVYASYQGKLIAPTYLEKISADNATISFEKSESIELKYASSIYAWQFSQWYAYSPHLPFLPILESDRYGYPGCLNRLKWYKLDRIKIKNSNDIEVESVNFAYNNTSTQRLMLTSVTESGKAPYAFEYHNIEGMPPYLSNKTDHWGFFNNTYAHVNDYSIYYTLRDPNATYMKYGIITSITYPTGGYTLFDFEPHSYRKQLSLNRWESCNTLSQNQTGGGLRIKSIKSYTSAKETPSTVRYFYTSDYLQNKGSSSVSSGVLGGQIQYHFTDYIVYAFNDKNSRRKMSAFTSNSVLPSCHNANGSPIGYTQVFETKDDGSFTRYFFSNFDTGYMDEPADAIIQQSRTPYEAYASKSQDRGLLRVQEDYDMAGVKVRSKEIVYEKDDASKANYVRSMSARYRNVCPGTAVSYDEGTSYKIYTYLWRVKSESKTIYSFSNSPLTTKTSISYNNHKLEWERIQAQSDGSELLTRTRYAADVLGNPDESLARWASYDDACRAWKKMIDNNMVGIPLEKTQWVRKNSQQEIGAGEVGQQQIAAAEVMLYSIQDDVVLPSKKYTYKAINEGDSYQGLSAFVEMFPLRPPQYPLGSYAEYYSHRKDPKLQLELSYDSYDNQGNLLQYTGRDGVPVSYLWGYNKQYPIAKVVGANFPDLESTLLPEQKSYLQKLYTPADIWQIHNRLHNHLPNAKVYGYSHRPLVGVTSEISPCGTSTYYTYDTFGRLHKVLDNNQHILKLYNYHYVGQPMAELSYPSEPSSIASISLFTNSSTGGRVVGSGDYTKSTYATVTAVPNVSVLFDGWYENNSKVSSNSSYSFTVAGNRMLEARFTIEHYKLSLSASSTEEGMVAGSGTFSYRTSVTAKATPNPGYILDGWYEGDTKVSSSTSYTFYLTDNRTLQARFTPSYTVTLSALPAEGGTVAGGGIFSYGSMVNVKATPSASCDFEGWYEGNTRLSANTSYSFTIIGNRTLQARFAVKYTITVHGYNTDPPGTISTGELGIQESGGKVSGGGTYSYGTSITIAATPNAGYEFRGWYEDDTWVSGEATYQHTVTVNRTLVAHFGKTSYSVRLLADPVNGGAVNDGGRMRTYLHGSTFDAKATPASGYRFKGWYGAYGKVSGTGEGDNDQLLISTATDYSFTVNQNITLTAKFEPIGQALVIEHLPGIIRLYCPSLADDPSVIGSQVYGHFTMDGGKENGNMGLAPETIGAFSNADVQISDSYYYQHGFRYFSIAILIQTGPSKKDFEVITLDPVEFTP